LTGTIYSRGMKRVVDAVCASVALCLLSPVMLALALIIKLEDGGPAIFRQSRVGRNLEPFTLFKFRSMPVAAPNVPSANAAQLRVTRIGRFIRRTNLDELPQLFNVLRGEMSLIGPRPALATQERLLKLRIEAGVMSARPGLTGLAQVNSYDGMADAEKVEWERRYVERITFAGDVAIIGRTFIYLLKPPPVY
jgi:O-antigen biosynthesis protein WbqP